MKFANAACSGDFAEALLRWFIWASFGPRRLERSIGGRLGSSFAQSAADAGDWLKFRYFKTPDVFLAGSPATTRHLGVPCFSAALTKVWGRPLWSVV